MSKLVNPKTADAKIFYPKDFKDVFALVIKPREFTESNAYNRPEMLCSVLVFSTEDSLLVDGRPDRIILDTIVTSGRLVRALKRALDDDGVLAGFIGKGETTSHGTEPWILEDLEPDEQAKLLEIWDQVVEGV